jgi:hypothetical protein
MMTEKDLSWRRRRTVTAPSPSNPSLPSPVINVECSEDEEVEWAWTETAAGRFVSGYCIVPRVHETARRSPTARPTGHRPGKISPAVVDDGGGHE